MQQQSAFAGSPCASYFDLVEKVGSKGPFQKRLVWLFVWALYSGGVGQLGPTFFFLMQPYTCQQFGLITPDSQCDKSICSLPQALQSSYLNKDFSAFTIPVEYGYQYCSGSQVVSAVYGFVYFGFLVSVFLRAFVVDSFGRRPLMVLFNGMMAAGSIIAVSSINIWVTGFGLFLVNCGTDGAMKFSFNFLAEYYDPQLRQKYSISIQVFYTLGYLLICGSSYFISDWRLCAGIFIVLPAVAGFIFCVCYLPEIPRYLAKQGVEHMMGVLNRIAEINKGQMVTVEDIANVVQKDNTAQSQRVNPLILCKFASLRSVSVLYPIVIFLILTLFYGSSILVGSFSLSPYIVGVVLACADFTVYLPAFKLIDKLKRKTGSLILSAVITGAALGISFISRDKDCDLCGAAIVEVILLFVFRFCSNFIYVVVLIYSNQLFPERVRAASSILELLGGLSLVINPALLAYLQKENISPMIYFTLSGAICFWAYIFLPQTNGIVKEEIQQLQAAKEKQKEEAQMSQINDISYTQPV